MTLNADHLKYFLNNHTDILVIPSAEKKLDALCSAVAFAHIAKQLKKNVRIVFSGIIPERLSFLALNDHLSSKNLLETKEALLCLGPPIYPAVGNGEFKHKNIPILSVTARQSDAIKNSNPSTFYSALSITSRSAGSISEIITQAVKEIDEELISKEVATPLLAGIIATSNNFQDLNIHPQTLFTAAYLISKRADHEKIVQYLYKTKPLELIRLWGSAIATFSYREKTKLGYSVLTEQDFIASGAKSQQVVPILNELKANFSAADIIVLSFNSPKQQKYALVHARKKNSLIRYAHRLGLTIQNNTLLIPLSNSNENNLENATLKLVEDIEKFL